MKTLQEHAREDCDALIARVRRLKHEAGEGKRLTGDRAAQILLTNHQMELQALETLAGEIKAYVLAGVVTAYHAELPTLQEVRGQVAREEAQMRAGVPALLSEEASGDACATGVARRVGMFPEHEVPEVVAADDAN